MPQKEKPEGIPSPLGNNMISVNISSEMKESYLDYAMSVITSRALPDVRDGLKPVHRRILYSMNELGLTASAKTRKSAAVVGEVLGKYHPHGDTAVYESMVKMAQEFTIRYPLVIGQGNFGCFTIDTKVKLTDGRDLNFGQLIKEYKQGKKNYTYTVNSSGLVSVAEIKKPRLTIKNAELAKVTLDNREEIRCTPNHRFMLLGGSYKEARDLLQGESLMPLYHKLSTREDRLNREGYSLIYQNKKDEWVPVHHLADNYNLTIGKYSKSAGRVRHHVDFNKLNNNPNNIARVSWGGHWKIHYEHASSMHKNPEYRKKIADGRKAFWLKLESKGAYSKRLSERNTENWKIPAYREKMRKFLSETNKKYIQEHPERRKVFSERATQTLKKLWKNPIYRQLFHDKIVASNKTRTTNNTGRVKFLKICKKVLSDYKFLDRKFYEQTRNQLYSYGRATSWETGLKKYYDNDPNLILYELNKNHKVINVELLNECEDVYDLTIDKTHNFALSAGVFAHNSVDGDSAAAMRYCVTGDTLIPTERGLLPIAKISETKDENIKTRILSTKGQINTASRWFDSGEHPTLSLKTNRGYSLKGSCNHPVLTWGEDALTGEPRFLWKLLSSIGEGDVVVIDRTADVLWPLNYLDLKSYTPLFHTKRVATKKLPASLTEDLGFILGLLISEGTINEHKIEFCNSDPELIEAFKVRWRKTFPDCRLHFFNRKPSSYGKKPYYRLEIHSHYVIKFLRSIGLEPLRSKDKIIPFSILQSPKSVVSSFLRSYFEGDGSISFSSKMTELSAVSKSKTLLNQVQIILLRFGMASTRRYDKHRIIDKLYIRGLEEYRLFEKEVGFFSSRKKTKLRDAIERLHKEYSTTDYIPFISNYVRSMLVDSHGGGRSFATRHNFDRYSNLEEYGDRVVSAVLPAKRIEIQQLFKGLSSQQYLFDVVTEVKKTGTARVYSLRVDSKCHSFVGNGFINHNTEAKMSRIASLLLQDLEKETVEWRPNYDATKREPVVLPAAVPNLILNGTLGIAVGMATSIPPHNLREILDATSHLIDNPDASTEDLTEFVKGPDFPTGGIVFGEKDLRHIYATGRGGVVTRGEAEIVEKKGGQYQIVITSIPYRVNKSDLIMKIADLVHEKKLEGIRDLRDESTKDIRIVVDLKQGGAPEKVLNSLYKHTELETMFHFNMLALVDGTPETLSLKAMLTEFVKHRIIVVRRRTQFDLKKAEDRAHILHGLKKALDHIDKIIKTIKASRDTAVAHENLKKEFKFSDAQTTAILDMKLQRLAGLERKKIDDELRATEELIVSLKDLLASPKKILKVIKDELLSIKEKYGDDRKTRVIKGGVKILSDEDLVAEKESVLVFTSGGYVKRTDPGEYKTQKRGGVGVVDLDTKEEDFVSILFHTSTHSDLLFFTDRGKAYQMKMYEIPEAKRATRGKSIVNYLSIDGNERVTSILPMPKAVKNMKVSLVMITKRGIIKKVDSQSFKDVRRSGLLAIKIKEGDELLSTFFAEKGDEVILASSKGQSIRFKESDVRQMGRSAGGVKAMTLKKGDELVGARVIKAGAGNGEFLVMSTNGYGKKTKLKEYKTQKRGGSGIKTMKITPKTGKLMVGSVVNEEKTEIIAMSKKSQVVRVPLLSVPSLGRQTQGVRIMKLREGDGIASLTCL